MEYKYYKSKWKHDDLADKTVQFKLTAPAFAVEGIGYFRVHVYDDLIFIEIVVPHKKEGFDNLYYIFESSLADKIEPHPYKSVADFRLSA